MKKKIYFIACLCVVIIACMLSGCTVAVGDPDYQVQPELDNSNSAGAYLDLSEFAGFEHVGFAKEFGPIGESQKSADQESDVWCYYYREKLTNVMYVWRTSGKDNNRGGFSYWSSGMTVMMNPDTGGPLVYEDWLALLNNAQGCCDGCGKTFSGNVPAFCPDCGTAIQFNQEGS